jgi:hypothetical protein
MVYHFSGGMGREWPERFPIGYASIRTRFGGGSQRGRAVQGRIHGYRGRGRSCLLVR